MLLLMCRSISYFTLALLLVMMMYYFVGFGRRGVGYVGLQDGCFKQPDWSEKQHCNLVVDRAMGEWGRQQGGGSDGWGRGEGHMEGEESWGGSGEGRGARGGRGEWGRQRGGDSGSRGRKEADGNIKNLLRS